MKKYDVFISYLRADNDTARAIYHELSAVGISCFFDGSSIISGDDFAREIAKSIESSKLVLYLCSDKLTQSRWAINEINFALAKGIKVLPVIIDNASLPDELKFSLSAVNGLKYNSSCANDDIANIVSEVIDFLSRNGASHQPPIESCAQPNKHPNPKHGRDTQTDEMANDDEEMLISDNSPRHPLRHQHKQSLPTFEPIMSNESKTSKKKINTLWTVALISIIFFFIGLALVIISNDEYHDNIGKTLLIFGGVSAYVAFMSASVASNAINSIPVTIYCDTEKRGHSSRISIYVDNCKVASIMGEGVAKFRVNKKEKHLISIKSADSDLKVEKFEYDPNEETSDDIKYVTLKEHSELKAEQKNTDTSDMTNYRCFIAGSTRLVNERNATRAVLSILYNKWEKYKLVISSYTFEDFSNGYTVGGQQIQYNEFIKHIADCTIFIVENGVGDKTLEEYKLAIATFKNNLQRPKVYVYANNLNNEPITQTFIEEVKRNRSYWREYHDINKLMSLIKEDIDAELFNIFVINNKHS